MKALIAMSGGVDSSAAALLMKERGYECIGCTMKLYDNEDAGIDRSKTCCSLDDVEDARSVARLLGMPYYVFNFKDDFKEKVIDKFIRCYECGMTPNPCIDCNHYLKFDRLYRRSQELGCDYIVTGHYAKVERCGDKWVLKKGLDETKDQSYVLYHMNQELLTHLLLPLGEMRKSEIREMAENHGFVNADKPDSQDICFVPDGDYARVIELHTGRTYAPGNFVTKDGKILGQHKGIIHYTIGQRRGLGIAADQPLYVCALDTQKNEVVLGHLEDLFSREVLVRDVNWISGEAPEGEVRCKVKTRYRQKEQPASVWAVDGPDAGSGGDAADAGGGSASGSGTSAGSESACTGGTSAGKWARIVFDEPQRAVTPGQSAVMYDGDVVLGGGTIVETFA